MRYWQLFWTVSTLVSGAAFAIITVVVAVKGVGDLRYMFRRLGEQQEHGGEGE
jgi:hypothetical protein